MIQKTYLDKAQLLVSSVFVALLPLDSKFLPHLIGLLAIIGLVQLNKTTALRNIEKYKPYYLFFILFFFWQLVSLIWTENIKSGLKLLEYKGFYAVAPFIFLLFKKWPTKTLVKVFILSNFIICLFCFAKLIPFFIYEKWYFIEKVSREGINMHTFRYIAYHGGANFITYDVHRLYVSFSVITSLLFLAFHKNLFTSRFLKYSVVFVFVFVILLLQSKTSVILFSVLMLYCFIVLFKSGGTKKRILISVVFLSIIGLGYYLNRIRFNQFINQVNMVSESQNGSFVERYQYTKCALELIKEAPLLGYGAGDIDNVMKEKIIKYNYNYLLDRGVYDPHNEFLKAYVGMGIIGFLSFLAIFISIFIRLRAGNNKLLFFYIGFVFVLCQIEPFLSRQAGILPTLFFLGLLVNYRQKNTENGCHY